MNINLYFKWDQQLLGQTLTQHHSLSISFNRKNQSLMDSIDCRLKNTSNLISQIRLIKINALEDKIEQNIKSIRENEIHHRKIKAVFDIFGSVLFLSMNLAMLVATFTLYYLNGLELSPSTAFTLISIAGILRHPLTWLSQTVRGLIKGLVSVGRLQAYYESEEIDKSSFKHETSSVYFL